MEYRKNKFVSNILPLIFVTLLVTGIYSCNNNDVVNTGSIPTIDDSILVTDETGRILGGDYSDWCLGYSGQRGFGPAYPNPTNDVFNVNFSVPSADTISIFFKNGNDTVFVMNKQPCQPGYYTFQGAGSTLGFRNSYRRLYITDTRMLFVSSSSCNNFGDIHFR
ncbi:MAG: hypothetical protein JSS63_00195 [Bacteroidetes bacterium]|nr:hypothetical protein [Bacteroidota bacterium]